MPVRRTPYSSSRVEPETDPRDLRGWWIPDAGFAALRVLVAMLLVWHGVQEMFGILLMPGQRFSGQPAPFTDPWILTTLKLAGGGLLALGLFTRSAAFVLALLVALDHLLANGTRAHWMLNGGELTTLYCGVLLAFAVVGPGLFSVDVLVRGRQRRRSAPGMTVSMSPWIKRQIRRRELTR